MNYMNFFLLILAVLGCQDNKLIDLTPNDGHRSHFAFNSLAFKDAILKIDTVDPGKVYIIDKPDGLIDRSPFSYDRTWISTDTFAFDPGDFVNVLSIISSTAESRQIQNSSPSPKLKWIEISGRMAYSRAKQYWLIPFFKDNGQIYFVQISRFGNWFSQKYTANGLWLESKKRNPEKDVS